MAFKKLDESLKERLANIEITEFTPFQKKVVSKVKSGASLFGVAPKGAGKSTSIAINVIQKLKEESEDDAPRALIVVKDREAALQMEAIFKSLFNREDLLLAVITDKEKLADQRDELYEGVDIVITTLKRLTKIYFSNGINLRKLELFYVDEADFIFKGGQQADIIRLSQSIPKCQYIFLSETYHKRFDELRDTFMVNAQNFQLK
jgi:superfamily II DNA/RNA helicase